MYFYVSGQYVSNKIVRYVNCSVHKSTHDIDRYYTCLQYICTPMLYKCYAGFFLLRNTIYFISNHVGIEIHSTMALQIQRGNRFQDNSTCTEESQ